MKIDTLKGIEAWNRMRQDVYFDGFCPFDAKEIPISSANGYLLEEGVRQQKIIMSEAVKFLREWADSLDAGVDK